jgi:hypothetical protein
MKMYEKPAVAVNDMLAEGVYAASGCYTVTANITQKPETGRDSYCIHVEAAHSATHHSTEQTLILSFNQTVGYVSSQGTLKSGDGTNTLSIDYKYHSNYTENIGLSDVYVTSKSGLAITGAQLTCNETCSQHDSN